MDILNIIINGIYIYMYLYICAWDIRSIFLGEIIHQGGYSILLHRKDHSNKNNSLGLSRDGVHSQITTPW
jgi:hypothetical protein